MANIPSGTKFIGIGASVPMPENRSSQNNGFQEVYTIDDIVSYVGTNNRRSYQLLSDNYSLLSTDDVVEYTSGSYNVTLPAAADVEGKTYTVTNSGNGTITVIGTVSGYSNIGLLKNYSIDFYSNGTNWIMI